MLRHRCWFVVLVVTFQGCASLPNDACRRVDWYSLGYQDGLAGRQPEYIAKHHPDCAAEGGVPDRAGYKLGRELGLGQFCQPGNGFSLGVRGGTYTGVCAGATEPEFLQAYEAGRQIYDAELQVRRLDEILAVNEAERDRLSAVLDRKRAALAHDGIGAAERASLRAELREIEATLAMVENEIDGIQAAIAEERSHLLSLRQANPHR